MLPSIPASHIVNINPAVLSAGGKPLALNTVLLVDTGIYPFRQYSNPTSVAKVFGFDSPQHKFAQTYFNGYAGSTQKPGLLFVARFNQTDKSAALVGASLSAMKLNELQALSGLISFRVDGAEKSATVDLSDVTSFSQAASKLSTDLSANVSFNTLTQSFVVTSGTSGDGSTLTYASGALAEKLGLTEDMGAILDNDTTQDSASTVMDKVTQKTLNFATIVRLGDSFTIESDKDIAMWTSKQNSRYWFVHYAQEATALQANNTACFGSYLKEHAIDGVTAIYGTYEHAALACGYAASLNFSEKNGRATMDFRRQAGLMATVTDQDDASALESNGYAYYGAWATANERFIFFKNTRVSGDFKWVDAYLNQVYFNSQLQLAFIQMLMSYKSVPYNDEGSAMHRAAAQDPINEMLNFGGIRAGIDLSEAQANQVNFESGFDAARQIKLKGYFLLLGKATAQMRANRMSLPAKLWYTDGGSVHSVNLASINVQ